VNRFERPKPNQIRDGPNYDIRSMDLPTSVAERVNETGWEGCGTSEEGLRKAVEWFRQRMEAARSRPLLCIRAGLFRCVWG